MASHSPIDAIVSNCDSGHVDNRKNDSKYFTRLIAELGIDRLLNSGVPVNIERVARVIGAETVRQANIPAAGMLLPTRDSFMILVNENDSPARRRFSCAHEIAHAILDPKLNPSMRRYSGPAGNVRERNCEKLAALLLMPDPAFNNYANATPFSIPAVINLARIFKTSIQATTVRFVEIVDEPSVVIVSQLHNGRSGRRLRVRWTCQNVRRLRGKPPYFIPRGQSTNLMTAEKAYRSNQLYSDTEDIDIGELRLKAYTEAKGFGSGNSRYVLSLVFPNGKQRTNQSDGLEEKDGRAQGQGGYARQT